MPGGFQIRVIAEEPGREWVVMLPGAGATSAAWFLQVRSFRKHFNVALIDLPGHTRDKVASSSQAAYSFVGLADALELTVREAGVRQCHVVALSLGTILARHWATLHRSSVRSMVLAGTIADLRPIASALMKVGHVVRWALPYMLLYRLYAWIIMPGSRHRATRKLFYRDARLLGREEFHRWFDLAPEVVSLLSRLRADPAPPPTLHVLGQDDFMFLRPAQRLAASQHSDIAVIPGVGHACSIEAADVFNDLALQFLLKKPETV